MTFVLLWTVCDLNFSSIAVRIAFWSSVTLLWKQLSFLVYAFWISFKNAISHLVQVINLLDTLLLKWPECKNIFVEVLWWIRQFDATEDSFVDIILLRFALINFTKYKKVAKKQQPNYYSYMVLLLKCVSPISAFVFLFFV